MNQPLQPIVGPEIGPVPEAATEGTLPEIPQQGPSVVVRLLQVLKREPVLFVTIAYVFVSVLGLWSSYWYFQAFNVPILLYLQSSDFFVAGLRRPEFLLVLGASLLWLWLSAWPMRWIERNPERAADYRQKHWWGRFLFPDSRSWLSFWGMRSDTMLLTGFLILAVCVVYLHSASSAARIIKGTDKGHLVRVSLSDGPLPGEASLLGTSSAFVFLWRAGRNQVEIVPIEAISRIESLHRPLRPLTPKGPAPAIKASK